MKTSSLLSLASSAVLLLLPLLLVGRVEEVLALSIHHPMSPPLRNPATMEAVDKVSKDVSGLMLFNVILTFNDI